MLDGGIDNSQPMIAWECLFVKYDYDVVLVSNGYRSTFEWKMRLKKKKRKN